MTPMILKGLSATVSVDGSPVLRLVHRETGEIAADLPIIRATKEHRSFILSTWIRSYAPVVRRLRVSVGTASSTGLGQDCYLAEEPRVAEARWENSWVVSSEDDHFAVHAWVCGNPGRLDYVYVPPELRGQGIAKAIIGHVCGKKLQYAKPWPFNRIPAGWTYNPYLLGK